MQTVTIPIHRWLRTRPEKDDGSYHHVPPISGGCCCAYWHVFRQATKLFNAEIIRINDRPAMNGITTTHQQMAKIRELGRKAGIRIVFSRKRGKR